MLSFAALQYAIVLGVIAGLALTAFDWFQDRDGAREIVRAKGYGKLANLMFRSWAIWGGGMTLIALMGMWISTLF